MGKEEQQEEREVLDSIFPDEISDISETEFRISIVLDTPEDNGEESESEPPTLILSVTYPPDYPDVAPLLDISAPPNAPKHSHINIQNDKDQLLAELASTIEENLGIAMIFTLVTTLKENAEQLMQTRASAAEVERELELRKQEEEENRKFVGTAVTRESFLTWRDGFRKEMEEIKKKEQEEKEAEEKKKKGASVFAREERGKMTGREIWEKGLAKNVDEEEDGDADGLDKLDELKVSA